MHADGVHCAILKERRASLSADIQGLLFLEYTHPESLAERLSRWIEDQVKEAERPGELEPKRRTRLLQVLSERFDEGELRTLCFNLEIKYEDLPAEGKANKARELIQYLERRERISDLVEAGKQLRPDIPWCDI
jgi:hypothetical protein